MINGIRLLACFVLALALVVGEPFAGGEQPKKGEQAKKQAKEKAKKPDNAPSKDGALKTPTHKVEKGPFKIEVTLKGVFEAEGMKEIVLSPKAWTPDTQRATLTVIKAVEHGTAVKKGDVLVELDLEKIDQAIKDLKTERSLAEVATRQAEEELPVLEKSLPLDLAAAERSKKQADEDLKKFLEVDRPLAEETAQHMVKNAQYYLDAAKEELRQLQKMYRSKDLTEETEEFILKRHRQQVESAEFSLKTALIRRDQTLKVDQPRQEQTVREKAAKEELALIKARNTLPLAVNQKRLALQKMRHENTKTAERLQNLGMDREAMTVRAPADGIVYHGKCVHGQWTTTAAEGAKLHRGGVLMPEEVFMTIVSTRPIFVRATVEEKDLHLLRPEMKGKAVVAGYPDLKLPAQLTRISAIPQTPGNFDARLAVEAADDAAAVMPGMACTVKLVAFQKNDALTVPTSAVFSDDGDDDVHYVYLTSKSGKPEKRPVKVGKTNGSKTEIIEGLDAGDEILTSKP